LILLFLYFGFMALRNAIDDPRRAESRMRRPRAGRGGERSHHLFLGAVVEYPAPRAPA
jgi:hypothetical protein